MSREEQHIGRMKLIVEIVRKSDLMMTDRLIAVVSFETGCSIAKAREDLNTLIRASKLSFKDGFVSIPSEKQTIIPGA